MVEATVYGLEEVFEHILLDIERTALGCNILANEAMDHDFSSHMETAIKDMTDQIRQNYEKAESKEALLPIINQQRIILQEKRKIYEEIQKTNSVVKFEAKATRALEFSTNLKLGYFVTDYLNGHDVNHDTDNPVKKSVQKFLIEKIVSKLKTHFEELNDTVLGILSQPTIDVPASVSAIKIITNNATDAELTKYFSDIEKTLKTKKPHQQIKMIKEKQEQFGGDVYENAKTSKTLTMGKQVSTISENDKILNEVSSQINILKLIKNPEAKKFYMTFFSGSGVIDTDPKKKMKKTETILNADAIILLFRMYFFNLTGLSIEKSTKANSEMDKVIDIDTSGDVDFDELDAFFENVVNFNTGKLNMNVTVTGEFRKPGGSEEVPEEVKEAPIVDPVSLLQGEVKNFASYKVTMTVLEDNWAEEEIMTDLEGILKKGEVREFILEIGEVQNFGLSVLNHHTLAYVADLDDEQFRIKNIDGKLYLIDQAITQPSKIMCLPEIKYRLTDGDYVDLGNEVLFQVSFAKSHKNPFLPNKPDVKNIRYLDEGISKAGTEIINNEQNFITEGEEPNLTITFQSRDVMNGKTKEFKRPTGDWAEKGYMIGREKCKAVYFQTHPKLDSVSRKQAYINYSEEDGWTIEDAESTSGTYVHPKQYVKAKTNPMNSYPVEMWDGIQIRVNTMILQFNIQQI